MGTEPTDVMGACFTWRRSGGPSRVPALLLHGLTGSRWSWEPQLEGLAGERAVVAWDAPGYGGSAPLCGDVSFAAYADAAVRCADEAGFERFHLAGLSFGGMIAQHVAIHHPDRLASLALLATSPRFGFDGVTTRESWRAARLAPLDAGQQPCEFAPAVLRAIGGPHISDDALDGQVRAAELVTVSGLRTAIDVLVTHDARAALGRITAPTVCLVGELDGETPPPYSRYLAEHIVGATLVTLPGAGHLVNVEAPDAVNRVLLDHFDRSEANR